MSIAVRGLSMTGFSDSERMMANKHADASSSGGSKHAHAKHDYASVPITGPPMSRGDFEAEPVAADERDDAFELPDASEILAQSSPDQTELSLFPAAVALRPRDRFTHNPVVYRTDVCDMDEIRRMNGKVAGDNGGAERPATWRDRMSSKHLGQYHLKYPTRMHDPLRVCYSELTLSLESDCITMPEFQTMLTQGKGRIELKFPRDQLAQAFAGVETLQYETGHIVPKQIWIKEEYASLPIDMRLSLQTNAVENEPSASTRKPVKTEWARPQGSHNTGSKESCQLCHMVPQVQTRNSIEQERTLYVAPESQNRAKFWQCINTNPAKLRREIKAAERASDPDYIEVRCGEDGIQQADSALQYLAIHEHQQLMELSKRFNDTLPRTEMNKANKEMHVISKKAMLELVRATYEDMDREKMWMNLRDLSVVLRPLRSAHNQAQIDLGRKIDMLKATKELHPQWFVRYTVKLGISYSVCDHELDEAEKRMGAPMAHHPGAHKAGGHAGMMSHMVSYPAVPGR